MQARNPCELFCFQKAWHAQFLCKEPRIVCAATPKCQARISFALLSIPRSSKRLLTGLFRKAHPSELWDLEEHLTRRRKEINCKYDSRGSRLTHVLGKLLYEGRVEEEQLRGLSQHQLNAIRSYKDFLSEADATEPGT
jgi:hypothetical protein